MRHSTDDTSSDDRSLTPCRVTFRDRGRSITVTMTSPAIRPNEVPLSVPFVWPVYDVASPTLVTGWIMPAAFTVDGLGVAVNFTTRAAQNDDGTTFVAIDTVTMTPTVPMTDMALPLAGLLRAAVKASGVRGIRVPPGERWTCDVWNDPTSYRPADDTSTPVMTQDGPADCWPVHVGPLTADEEARMNVKAITGTGRAPRTALTDDVLAQVAEVVKANPGKSHRHVAQTFGISMPAARERIRKARDRGYLPPTADHYKNRKKAT